MNDKELYLACLHAVRAFNANFGSDPRYVQLRIAANIAWQRWLSRKEISA